MYPQVFLEGSASRYEMLSSHRPGPRAVLNALDRLLEDYPQRIEKTRQDLAIAQNQLRDYQARLGAEFPHERYYAELLVLRDQLKGVLSGAENNEENKPLPQAAELAQHIKTLLASKRIEPDPKRLSRADVAAEVPVARRVRHKAAHFQCDEPYVEPSFDKLTAELLITPGDPGVLDSLLDDGHEASYVDELPPDDSADHHQPASERLGASNRAKKRQTSLF